MYKHFFKGFFDIAVALTAIIVLLPLFIVIAIAIKIDSRGKLIFKQKRVAKNKKLFSVYKFRTMKSDAPKDTPTHLLQNPESYITKVGKFLRKYSLDELPQLFNILFGKMSFVGPRPALYNQHDLISERDKYGVNRLKPGLTGYAQVSGRDELTIQQKAAYDGEYAAKLSFFGDIKILFATAGRVIRANGVKEGAANENIDSRKR